MKNKNHVITRTDRAECGAVCQNDRLSAGHIWQTRSHVYGEVKCKAEIQRDVVIPNELDNGETCQGLRHWRLLSNLKNNFSKPVRNDMIIKTVKNLFPYFPISLSFKKKIAFTLAETLITLGIIGIVAAMTIPNLITSANQKATVSRLIEAQSILNQAVKSYTADSDEEGSADFDTSLEPKEFAEKYFKPYLKVARVCTKMEDGCWKTGNFYGYYDLAGNKVTDVAPYSLVLNNGMIIGFSKISGTKLYAIVVDVDGHSNRNVMGRDVHSFYPYNRDNLCSYNLEKWKNLKNGLYPGGFDNCGAPHLAYSREELLEGQVLRPCNKNKAAVGGGGRTGVGSACAAVIFKDGWKISKDYPW